MKDVEDALQRLDKLTQEETRMAAAEALKIMQSVNSQVQGVDHKVGSVIQGELYMHQPVPESVLSPLLQ